MSAPKRAKIRFVHGLKCQGNKERDYIEYLVVEQRPLPKNGKRIATPFGAYTPDFEFEDKIIEIKGIGTLKVLLNLEPYITPRNGVIVHSKQLEKIEWLNATFKPVQITVWLNPKTFIPLSVEELKTQSWEQIQQKLIIQNNK